MPQPIPATLIPGDGIGPEIVEAPLAALEALEAWLNATPAEGRHVARIAKIDELDGHLVDDER